MGNFEETIELPTIEEFFENIEKYIRIEKQPIEKRFNIKMPNGAMMYNLTKSEVEKMKNWLPIGYQIIEK